MKEEIHIHYDTEGDYLEICFGDPKPAYFKYVGDDTFERRDEKTNRISGYSLYNVKKHPITNLKIPLSKINFSNAWTKMPMRQNSKAQPA